MAYTPASPLDTTMHLPSSAPDEPDAATASAAGVADTLRGKTAELKEQAGEKVRTLVEDGKTRATDALDQLSQMLADAAVQVDERLGEQYGEYARAAAERVEGWSDSLDDTSLDDLIDSARELVRKSPAVAIGAAATIGFVVARLLAAGLDQRGKA